MIPFFLLLLGTLGAADINTRVLRALGEWSAHRGSAAQSTSSTAVVRPLIGLACNDAFRTTDRQCASTSDGRNLTYL